MTRNILTLLLLVVFIFLSVIAVRSYRTQFSRAEVPVSVVTANLIRITPISSPDQTAEQKKVNDIEQKNLQNDLEEEIKASGLSDDVSLYYNNLDNGYEVNINSDRSWVPASMVKAYIVIEAFRQNREKLINFDSRVSIKKENVVPTELESADYQPLREGVKATIRELVYAMIVQSDNTAYNTLLDVLDRRNITTSLRNLGLNNTVVGEKLSLSDDQYAKDLLVPGRQPNRTTAYDFGRLFTLLYEGKIDDSDEMLTIFKQQKFKDMIPSLLPSDVVIAHKTGFWSPYFHDGGIVYKPKEPYVLSVFTDHNDPSVVARLSKIAYYKTRDVLGLGAENIFEIIKGKIISIENWIKDSLK